MGTEVKGHVALLGTRRRMAVSQFDCGRAPSIAESLKMAGIRDQMHQAERWGS
jgi:hypothetical protein